MYVRHLGKVMSVYMFTNRLGWCPCCHAHIAALASESPWMPEGVLVLWCGQRAGSTLHGAQDSCLAQMKAELEHLQLLTDALRAKEVKEAQANGVRGTTPSRLDV